MKKEKLYILILSILNSFIIYDYNLGLNIILFTIPLLLFIFFYLKLNKLIVNKKGLLFLIPIIILSTTYCIYDNIFKFLNILVIPILYILMYIYTMKKENTIIDLLCHSLRLMLKPVSYIGNLFASLKKEIENKIKIKNENKEKIKSLIIIAPIVLIILLLLGSADMIFGNIFKDFFKIFDRINVDGLCGRIIYTVALFIYIASTMLYLKDFKTDEVEKKEIKVKEYTIKLLLTILNVIYVIFDIIQINSLMLHRVSQNINYAEYARSGFFQLMFISLINIIIILISKKCKETKYNRNMSLVMIGLTLIIIASSFMRMYLYESTYGYTVLRLGVYITLATEVLLFIPTIMYILNKKIDILKSYIVIITIVYTFINLFSIEKVITNNNINRFYKTGKIDIYYLENYNYDNIPQLINFYEKCNDKTIQKELGNYLYNMKNDVTINTNSILEYNYPKYNAIKQLNDINNSELLKEGYNSIY